MTDKHVTQRTLINTAQTAMSVTGASLVAIVHESGLAALAAQPYVTSDVAADALRHLAEHVEGTATCCGDPIQPLGPVPPC